MPSLFNNKKYNKRGKRVRTTQIEVLNNEAVKILKNGGTVSQLKNTSGKIDKVFIKRVNRQPTPPKSSFHPKKVKNELD